MSNLRTYIIAVSALFCAVSAHSQTSSSLFLRSDSLQVAEIIGDEPVMYRKVGHHGPAVENAFYALRIYYNDSGAIDLYSKSGAQMELDRYLWYPTEEQQKAEGAGCDEYLVGKTVGLGGFALWDNGQEVKLVAEKRIARVGRIRNGSFAEIISYGVSYKGTKVDVGVRVEMYDDKREAKVTAWELNGAKVQFLTGVNYHPGESWQASQKPFFSSCAVWGVHPADVSAAPSPIGAGIKVRHRDFPQGGSYENAGGALHYYVSKPCSKVSTWVTAASSKESEINTEDKFFDYVRKL